MAQFGALDLGATNVRAAVGDTSAEFTGYARRETPQQTDGDGIAEVVTSTLERACDRADCSPTTLDRTGIGSVGPLDGDAGVVVDPPNLPGVAQIPLVEAVETLTGGQVVLYNDATAGALGEWAFGPAATDNLVYLTLSTGLGAGAVVDGHLLTGHDGNAAEMGHVTLAPDLALPCGCGTEGHWEALCAGDAIPALSRHLSESGAYATDLAVDTIDAATVFDARETDPLAAATVETVGEYNARGVATLVHAYDPAVVVVGGSVALNNPDAILGPIREQLPALTVHDAPPVRLTAFGDDAVLKGALAAATGEAGNDITGDSE